MPRQGWGFGPWTFAEWASLATIYSLLVVAAVAIVALVLHWLGRQRAEDARMHALFRNYLAQRAAFAAQDRTRWTEQRVHLVDDELMTFRHQVLEELFIGLRDQWPKTAFGRGLLTVLWPQRRDLLLGWKQTLAVQLRLDARKSGDSLLRNHACYSTAFLAFAGEALRRRDLVDCALNRTPAWQDLVTTPLSTRRLQRRSVNQFYFVPHD